MITEADALDAAVPVGRHRRLALPRELLRDVPRHLAPRRLDQDHRSRDGDHLRPLGFDDQPRRRPDGDLRDLPGGAVFGRGRGRVGRRRAARPARTDGCRCSWSCGRARCSTTRSLPRSAGACARTARRATSRTRCSRSQRFPGRLSGKVLEVPVKRILTGTPPDQAASRESLANPAALDYFVELGGKVRSAGLLTSVMKVGPYWPKSDHASDGRRARSGDLRSLHAASAAM